MAEFQTTYQNNMWRWNKVLSTLLVIIAYSAHKKKEGERERERELQCIIK